MTVIGRTQRSKAKLPGAIFVALSLLLQLAGCHTTPVFSDFSGRARWKTDNFPAVDVLVELHQTESHLYYLTYLGGAKADENGHYHILGLPVWQTDCACYAPIHIEGNVYALFYWDQTVPWTLLDKAHVNKAQGIMTKNVRILRPAEVQLPSSLSKKGEVEVVRGSLPNTADGYLITEDGQRWKLLGPLSSELRALQSATVGVVGKAMESTRGLSMEVSYFWIDSFEAYVGHLGNDLIQQTVTAGSDIPTQTTTLYKGPFYLTDGRRKIILDPISGATRKRFEENVDSSGKGAKVWIKFKHDPIEKPLAAAGELNILQWGILRRLDEIK